MSSDKKTDRPDEELARLAATGDALYTSDGEVLERGPGVARVGQCPSSD